jgi:hypothetical protein
VSEFVAADNVFTGPLNNNSRGADHRKHRSSVAVLIVDFLSVAAGKYLPGRCLETALVNLFISRSLQSNGSTLYNIISGSNLSLLPGQKIAEVFLSRSMRMYVDMIAIASPSSAS